VACEVNYGGAKEESFYASTPPLEAKKLLFGKYANAPVFKGKRMRRGFVDAKKAYFNGVPSAMCSCACLVRWGYLHTWRDFKSVVCMVREMLELYGRTLIGIPSRRLASKVGLHLHAYFTTKPEASHVLYMVTMLPHLVLTMPLIE
jgi:hypothetical protein